MINRIAQRGPLLQSILIGLLITSFFAAALYLRIAFSYDVVFGGDTVRYTGVDAYYHIRIIDNLAHNFPHLSSVDPYMIYPGPGGTSSSFPFFDYLVAGIIWMIGLGSPTQHTVDTIAPYFPPVLAALTVIPAYFIGKTLFNRWAGVVAAGLVAILPGEFLGRSILGFADHHVAETLFSTTAVMFLILALKNAKKEPMTWEHLKHPNKNSVTKPAVYGLLAGVFLGIYLTSWMGALLFVFIIAAFFIIQFFIDHLREKPTDYLCLAGVTTFLPALLIFLLVSRHGRYPMILAGALCIPVALFVLSRLMTQRGLKPIYHPVAVCGLGLAAFGILYASAPSLVKPMLDDLGIFRWQRDTTVAEMVPFLYERLSNGQLIFSLRPFWEVYRTSILLSPIAFCIVAYLAIRKGEAEKTLLIVWTLVMLLATFAQRRFNYYLVVNIAVLTGYLSWEVLRLAGLRETSPEPSLQPETPQKAHKLKSKKAKKPERSAFRFKPTYAYVALTSAAIFLFLYFPTIDRSIETARVTPEQPRFAPTSEWLESLNWLRENTDEPFGDSDFYYARYGDSVDYSQYPQAYGVTAWWDYGYWIVRIGHRPPSQNPGGAIPAVAEFFLSQDETEATRILDERGARYIMLDYSFVTGKYYGAINVTGKSEQDFYEDFLVQTQDNKTLESVRLYYPEYYQSMSVRLYNFGGKVVTPGKGECMAVSWKFYPYEGVDYKLVTDTETFDTYEKALEFIATHPNYRIVGWNPFVSPVPLEELKTFRLCYDTKASVRWEEDVKGPALRIFEYQGAGA